MSLLAQKMKLERLRQKALFSFPTHCFVNVFLEFFASGFYLKNICFGPFNMEVLCVDSKVHFGQKNEN